MPLFDTTGVDLRGQVVLVTGGGRGLGRAMALALSAANASVAITARTEGQLAETSTLIQQSGGACLAIPADIADRSAVERMMERVTRELGEIDTLVNNAGVFSHMGPIWETSYEDWQNTFDVNLTSAFLCSQLALKSMVNRQRGRIINIASGAALRSYTYGSSYCISKAALVRLTECIADDAKKYGIAAFAVDPGSVYTTLSAYLIESEEAQTYIPWFGEHMRNGGAVPPEWSASLVTLLASGKADSLSGRFITVHDDLLQMVQDADTIEKDDLYTLRLQTPSPQNDH